MEPQNANLRRNYLSGVWAQIRSSERYRHVHAKIHRLQIDNQTYDCVFPVVLFPVPPPKSVVTDELSGGMGKPFAELSIVERVNEESHIRQYKYLKLLIQEFHVKMDIGFLNGFVNFCEVDNVSEEQELAQFKADEEVVHQTLFHHVTNVTHQDFYDVMHFSPLKMHLSFSLAGENPTAGTPHQGMAILNLVTQSIGVTLTDFHDVVFRLAYFERKHKFYSAPQLTAELKQHYMGQFVKQLYVLVLGLDVLGNPFGLVTGLKQGVEDFFYEPFQGFIQGPSEFAEGIMLGVRSLFGHTVGGAAGAVGRITGAMGKGIAALTLDEEYQKRRRERLGQNQSMTEGGRELFMGVVEGIEGMISKPISGAREEGGKGFVKGVGKGVVGLFMRPASGVVDFASGTVDAVRRVATCSEEVRRYRLPRLIKENGQVVPYSLTEAKGYKYLLDAEKGKFTKTDVYLFHINMGQGSQPSKEILLFTDRRMLYIVKGDIFADHTRVDWQYTWNEIREQDGVGETEDGIYIRIDTNETRRSGSRLGNIFRKTDRGKVLKIPDEQLRQWLLRKIREFIRKGHSQ